MIFFLFASSLRVGIVRRTAEFFFHLQIQRGEEFSQPFWLCSIDLRQKSNLHWLRERVHSTHFAFSKRFQKMGRMSKGRRQALKASAASSESRKIDSQKQYRDGSRIFSGFQSQEESDVSCLLNTPEQSEVASAESFTDDSGQRVSDDSSEGLGASTSDWDADFEQSEIGRPMSDEMGIDERDEWTSAWDPYWDLSENESDGQSFSGEEDADEDEQLSLPESCFMTKAQGKRILARLQTTAQNLAQRYRSIPQKTAARARLVSKLFNDSGQLILFPTRGDAARALGCNLKTIDRGRQHAIRWGSGGTARFRRRRAERKAVIYAEELNSFATDQSALQPSSCRTTADGTPIQYLTTSVMSLWKIYSQAYCSPCPRSLFYAHFAQPHFEKMTLLSGLCSTCDATGYFLRRLVGLISSKFLDQSESREIEEATIDWIRHCRSDLAEMPNHIHSPSHCYDHAIGVRCCDMLFDHDEEQFHSFVCTKCESIFKIIGRLSEILQQNVPLPNDPLRTQFDSASEMAVSFMAHRLRTRSTNITFGRDVQTLTPGNAILVFDFKQKLLKLSAREAQSEYFGKRAFASLFCGALLTSSTSFDLDQWCQLEEEAIAERNPAFRRRREQAPVANSLGQKFRQDFFDIFSEDTTQDSLWVMSALEALGCLIAQYRPDVKNLSVWADNASNFHNPMVAVSAPFLFKQSGITLQKFRFFEPGEGKNIVDRHWSVVRHKTMEKVRREGTFDCISHLENVLAELSGVRFFRLSPLRNGPAMSISPATIPGITRLSDWRYTATGDSFTTAMYNFVAVEHVLPPSFEFHVESFQPYADSEPATLEEYLSDEAEAVIRTAPTTHVRTLPLTFATISLPTFSSEWRMHPPLIRTLQAHPPSLTEDDFVDSDSATSHHQTFGMGWASPLSRQAKRTHYHPLITRALLFYFWRGEPPTNQKMTPQQIFQRMSHLLRQGRFGDANLVSEMQIKQWMANRANLRKRDPASFTLPDWCDPKDEECIFRTT
jgi:hypothetical protein